jgi:hypothetical protein
MKIEGHLAGGWLASKAVLGYIKPASKNERFFLLGLGTLAGFLPDLDFFWYLWKKRGITYESDFRHHTWVTHTFIFYWIPAGLLFIAGSLLGSQKLKHSAVILAAGTTAHLMQDMVGSGDGIMIAYPISRKMVGIGLLGKHGREWLEAYLHSPVYRVELGIIVLGLTSFIKEVFTWRKVK